ncbi:MAG: hypothetical protein WCJ95_17765 [Mariniphaga sp.]
MNFTEEHLNEVEEMAGLFFSPEDIAINMELDDEQTEHFITAIEAKKTAFPFVAAYLKGWFTAEVTLRRAIRQSALNGSSPSQQAMLNYQREARS